MDWKDYEEIASALKKLYPDRSPRWMANSELIKKIKALPGFSGKKNGWHEDDLSAITGKWAIYRGEYEYGDPREYCP
jgi:FeS assembly protein IscX